MYIIAQISNQADAASNNGLLELNGAHNLPKGIGALRQAAAANYSLPVADVYVFDVSTLSQAIQGRLRDGDEFDLTWAANAVTGVDFTKEDAKFIVDVTISVNPILGDGADFTPVTIRVFQADGTTPASINGMRNVPIKMPVTGHVRTQVNFTNGVGSFTFRSNVPGIWSVPNHPKRITLNGGQVVRVRNSVNIEVLAVF